MGTLSILYLSVALGFFANLFQELKNSTDLSSEQRECSLKVMTLAAVFWPIVLPISYLEKHSKAKQGFYKIQKVEANQAILSPKFEIKSETNTKLRSNIVDRKDQEDKEDKGDKREKVLYTNATSYKKQEAVVQNIAA